MGMLEKEQPPMISTREPILMLHVLHVQQRINPLLALRCRSPPTYLDWFRLVVQPGSAQGLRTHALSRDSGVEKVRGKIRHYCRPDLIKIIEY